MKRAIRWYRASPLLKKMTMLTFAVLLIPGLILSVFLFRFQAQRQIEKEIAHNEAVLQAIANDVRNQLTYVQSAIDLMAESDAIRTLLISPPETYGDMAVMLLYDVNGVLEENTAYLRDMDALIMLIPMDERIPEVYENVMHHGSMLSDESYLRFSQEGSDAAWGQVGYFMPLGRGNANYYAALRIPYYKSVNTAFSRRVGTIKCSISPARLFSSLHPWIDASALMVFQGGARIWFAGDSGFRTPETPRMEAWREGGTLYLPVSMNRADMTLVLAADYHAIQTQALLGVLPLAFLVSQAFVLIVIITRALLRSILRRLQVTVEAMGRVGESGAPVRLPEGDLDEIGMLITSFNSLLSRIDSQHTEILDKEIGRQHAQVLALQYQMNPHFLFNSLHWLQIQVEMGAPDEDLSNAIALLGDVLHYSLSAHPYATVGMELNHIDGYIAFIQLWKRTVITLQIECDIQARDHVIPRFTLQPLVENAVWHGMMPDRPLWVGIVIRQRDGAMVISVTNDGRPVTAEGLADMRRRVSSDGARQTEHGIGLSNLAHRLYLLYGDAACVDIETEAGKPCITLRFPMRAEEAIQRWTS